MQHYRSAFRSTLLGLTLVGAVLGVCQPAAAQHKTWYLAEGASNAFFQEEILIANPNAGEAKVNVAFLLEGAPEVNVPITIPGTSRYTLRVNDVAGLENATASAVVTSDVDVLVERSMFWPGASRRGGHHSVAVPAPAPKWYLAEGSLGFFQTFILIGNPGNAAADVKVTYLRADDAPLTATYSVPARSRRTIYVNEEAPTAGEFSTVVETTNGTNIVVERAMYWNNFEGGHNATGITTPATTWGFAEGFTGSGFNTFILLGNPNATDASVRLTYLFDDGSTPFQQTVTVAANSRRTIEANTISELQNRAFSTLVEVQNSQPIIAERAMYFGGFLDGHATGGLTTLTTKWGFAEGLEDRFGTGIAYETFYLLANTTTNAATVLATFYREDGRATTHDLTVPAQSRITVSGKAWPELSNQRFAAFFEVTNAVNIGAERVVYWGADRFGGMGSTGTPWTGTIAAPAAAPGAPNLTSVTPNTGVAGNAVAIVGTNFHRDTQVQFGGTAAAVVVESATRIVAIVPARSSAGAVNVTLTGPTGSASLTNGFTYQAVAPPPPPPNRTPDPPAGQLLPLPNMAGIVAEVAAANPGDVRNSCQETGGSWAFIDKLVDRLRQIDTRWGYNCKRGNCPDLSQDVVAYHAGAGPEVNGALETYTIDVIAGHCGPNPVQMWSPHQYIGGIPDAARWHNRFRF